MQEEKSKTPNEGVTNSKSDFTTENSAIQQQTVKKLTAQFKQSLDYLPTEIKSLKRFIPVRDDKKTPKGSGWQKAENQKFLSDIATIHAAFFIKSDSEQNFLVLDFDNVLKDDGTFSNDNAYKFYNSFRTAFPENYCEVSASGHGLHIIFRPSVGKFQKIHAAFDFDTSSNSKCEVFFDFNKTCTLTGKLFNCEPNSAIPNGEIADDFILELLKKIERQNDITQSKKFKSPVSKDFLLSDEYETARSLAMLDCIQFSQLDFDDWFSVITSCKNLRINYNVVDAKNREYSRYNEPKNLEIWNSISNNDIGMANLHAKAKMFGYDNKTFFEDWRKNHSTATLRAKRIPINNSVEIEKTRATSTKAIFADCPIDLLLAYPSKFLFTKDGIKRYSREYGYISCCHTPVVVTKRFLLQTNKIQYEVAFLNHANKWQSVTVDADVIADSRKIIQLANFGVGITSTDAKYLSAFLMEQINFDSNKFTIPTIAKHSKIGWMDDDCRKFISPYNDQNADYIVERKNYNYSKIFATKGDCHKWISEFTNKFSDNTIAKFIFGAALLAPLVKPLNLMNVWLHIHGPSSSGKTALVKAAVSIYGNPATKDGLGRTLDASKAYFMSVVEGLNCFPILFDELESLPNKFKNENIQSLIYNFTGGTSGQRGTRNGEERELKTFNNVIITTGEQPISTDNSKRGAVKRLLELRFNQSLDEQIARYIHIFFEKNYGHFGQKWIDYVVKNTETLQAKFDGLLAKVFNTSPEDRQIEKDFKKSLNNYDATNLKVVLASLFAFKHFINDVLMKECESDAIANLNVTYEKIDEMLQNDLQEIIGFLPTMTQLDETERARAALTDFVNGHPKNFVKEVNKGEECVAEGYETCGKKYLNGDVAFFKTSLTKILEKELSFSSCNKLLAEWKDRGYIQLSADGRTKTTARIGGNSKPVIKLIGLVKDIDDVGG